MAGESHSTGSSFSVSQSTSTPVPVDTAQSNWGLMQSQLLSALGNQQYQWAMQQYAKGEGVTDQTIANFLELSGKGKGLAETLLNQYSDQIKPLMDQYIREAGSYASEGRQRFEAGKAMSTVAQADKAAMDEMARKIGDFGVNVNSGRYMDSMLAARTQDAAARAGAGTAAAGQTEAIGRQMTERAIGWGQNMPGQAINAIQSSYAGLTGAENAVLGLMNTGANLAQSAAPFFNAAVAANKLPPVGQQSQSTSQGGSQQKSDSQQRDKEGGEGGQRQPRQLASRGKDDDRDRDEERGDSMYPDEPYQTVDMVDITTGAPEYPGYTGAVPYFDPTTGNLMDQWTPDFARYNDGTLQGPEVWDSADFSREQVSNWSMPPSDQGNNLTRDIGYGNQPGADPFYSPRGTDPSVFDTAPSAPGYQFQNAPYNDYGGQPLPTIQYGNQGGNAGTPPGGSVPQFRNTPPSENTDPNQPVDLGLGRRSWADQLDGYQQAVYQPPGGGGGDTWSDIGRGSMANDPRGGQDFTDYENPSGVNDEVDYENPSGVNDYDDSYDDWSASEEEDGGYYGEDDDSSYYDDWSASEEEDGGYYGEDDDSSYYDDWNAYGGGFEESDGYGGGDNDYGGEEFSGYSEDYYAQGGRVRPRRPMPPGMRPGREPPRRQRPMQNGAISQRPMLRRPAQGGVMPTSGGAVPRSASPSQGKQTDDISARLNAGEYVIPRDVVKHQGTKFFTDLIQKSRKLRTGMAGAAPKPTMKPALPQGRPTFQSRALPPR